MTQISNLPLDLLEEILSRVPATSVKRLRSICKRWKAIFKDERFIEKHFSKAPKDSMVLMLKRSRVCPVSVNLNVSPPSLEIKDALCLKDSNHSSSKEVYMFNVFHCDGLLLCTTRANRLLVCNPSLGETTLIPCKTIYRSSFTLGYVQTNKFCRSYKILRIWGFYKNPDFEIYEFSSDSWRVLDDVVLDCSIHDNAASSLKGNTYWVAIDKKDKYGFILSFNFATERFKRLRLPTFQNRGTVTLSVGKEEQLSALNRSYDRSKLEMWVTNKTDIESELLWSKSFIVDLPTMSYSFNTFTSLLIDAEKKVSLSCNIGIVSNGNLIKVYTIGEDNEYYVETPNQWWDSCDSLPVIFNYVPSLFQIR